MTDVVQRIEQFNQGRDPELLTQKYKLMRADVFSFFRGTCHLFYQDWPKHTPLNDAPAVWISGDLHLENFGSYRADNRLVYFDINDFDEAALAPCTWELARVLTSILVGHESLEISPAQAAELCQVFATTYAENLAKGHAFAVERATSTGLVRELLYSLKQRTHKAFLDQHTVKQGSERRLRVDNLHTMTLPDHEHEMVKGMLEAWGNKHHNPQLSRVIDVVRHAAGTGSLGLANYLVLTAGEDTSDLESLLTFKQEVESSLHPYLITKQPTWSSEAERVVTAQKGIQAVYPAMHYALTGHNKAYTLREYQPEEDRVLITTQNGKFKRITTLITTLAEITAWDHLRSTGHYGAQTADELMAFGARTDWQPLIVDYARQYAAQVKTDFEAFAAAQDTPHAVVVPKIQKPARRKTAKPIPAGT